MNNALSILLLCAATMVQALPPDNSTMVEPSDGRELAILRNKLYELQAGERKALTVLRIGDSLTGRLSMYIERDVLASWYPGIIAQDNKAKGGTSLPAFPGQYRRIKEDYTLSFLGSFVVVPVGEEVVFAPFQTSGQFAKFVTDTIKVPFVKSPGGGKFRLSLSDSTIGDIEIIRGPAIIDGEIIVDTNAEITGIDWLEIGINTADNNYLTVTHVEGGELRLLHPMLGIYNQSAINFYHLGEGSNDFIHATSESVPIMASLIEMLHPDIITTHSDDGEASYMNFLPLLEAAIEQANLPSQPLVLLIGAGPKINFGSNNDYTDKVIAANAYQRQFAIDNGHTFLDLMTLANDMNTLLALNLAGDGVHLTPAFHRLGALAYGRETGLIAPGVVFSDDLDGDGISDLDELHTSGSHPLLSDTDGDGLDDLFEQMNGLSPRVPVSITLQSIEDTAPALLLSSSLISAENGVKLDLQFWESQDLMEWTTLSPESVDINAIGIEVDLGELPQNRHFYKVEAR